MNTLDPCAPGRAEHACARSTISNVSTPDTTTATVKIVVVCCWLLKTKFIFKIVLLGIPSRYQQAVKRLLPCKLFIVAWGVVMFAALLVCDCCCCCEKNASYTAVSTYLLNQVTILIFCRAVSQRFGLGASNKKMSKTSFPLNSLGI